jgi:16S rRNA (cytosine967-C5)-methyltransferase
MTARDHALHELDLHGLPHWPPRTLPRRGPARPQPPADPRDRALAEQIAIGVTKNLLLLQHLIQHHSGRSLKSIDPLVQKILAIGLYQLRFLTRIPPSAAVDEAVEQAKRFGRGKAGGFVNAVLRKATRDPDPPLPAADDDPREHARVALSHPPDVFDRYVALTDVERALELCRHDNREPPTVVRLFASVSLEQLQAPGVTVAPHEQPAMLVVEPAKVAVLAEWARHGLAQAQDPTSALVVGEMEIQPGQTVLDRCCGLGTKTLQMCEAVGDAGVVVAMDPAERRISALRGLVEQRRLRNVAAHVAGRMRDLPPEAPASFDRVLIDAPCSNSGVLARRPEARYHQTPGALKSIARVQLGLLDDTAPAVAPRGRLVYSTCSIWPEENERIVDAFLQRHPEFAKLRERATLPHSDANPGRYHDGGYVAVLRREPRT